MQTGLFFGDSMKKTRIEDKRRYVERNEIPTLSDVAKFAGVSVMSVWRTMNGESAVSDGIRRKVAAAVEAMHYAPNHPARILAGAGTIRIGIIHNQDSRFLSEFLLSLSNQSVLNKVNLVIAEGTRVDEAGNAAASGVKVDGMIFCRRHMRRQVLSACRIFPSSWLVPHRSTNVSVPFMATIARLHIK